MTEMTPDRRQFVMLSATGAAAFALFGCRGAASAAPEHFEVTMTDAQWKAKLSPAAYDVLRHEGTEAPFSSPLNAEHHSGIFSCAGCALPVYSSKTKFESGTGWPSFWAPLPHAVSSRSDASLMMERTEIHCRRCGGHLGHVFDDGPKPTGKRYCMNGVAMKFTPGKG
jgi:peptide-methionine (R)-S-oxide reductase